MHSQRTASKNLIKAIIPLFLLFMFLFPVTAKTEEIEETVQQQEQIIAQSYDYSWLTPAEPQYVCMVNNRVFKDEQIPVVVEGKTYYGCCAMCKKTLAQQAAIRQTSDPVSNNIVDKASAVIGSDHEGKVYYFENEENMQIFDGMKPEL